MPSWSDIIDKICGRSKNGNEQASKDLAIKPEGRTKYEKTGGM